MNIKENAQAIVTLLKNKDIQILDYFCKDNNDEITNAVREELSYLDSKDIQIVSEFLEELLNACYENKENITINKNSNELFLIKENIIYYMGRLSLNPNLELLKKLYYLEDDIHIKLNITYTLLSTFDEEIEMDFIHKLIENDEYDLCFRSWTIAFLGNKENPYSYVDNGIDDWSEEKNARMKRLQINTPENPKYKKAIEFRLMDLIIIYLFLRNRESDKLTEEELLIIQNISFDYPLYSEKKKDMIQYYQNLILSRCKTE